MNPYVLCALAAIILLALASAFARRASPKTRETPTATSYRPKGTLLTAAEADFLETLERTVDPDLKVFAMVRLGDVITPVVKDQAALNRVLQKHVDFVVCDRRTYQVKLAIELNDSSHRRPDRMRRDAFMADAMREAGIPLLFIPVRRTYDAAELRNLLAQSQQPGLDAIRAPAND